MKKILKFFFILILIIISILLYSRYVGTKGLIIKEYSLKNTKLSDDFYGLKIVHITDIHYGRTTTKKELENLVNKINLVKPDIVILSGDLFEVDIDYSDNDKTTIIDLLSKIDSNIGKYAIKGDTDNDMWEEVITTSGFKNLNNTYDLIYTNNTNYILLSGMDSNISNKTSIEEKLKSTNEFLNSTNIKPNYSILVMHEADYIKDFDYSNYNLILAGHSLNGQMKLPFIGPLFRFNGSKKYCDNHYKLKGSNLYISGGIGTYKYSFRLFNHPSFNFYRLTNK